MKKLMDEKDVAELLGVSVHKLRRDRWAGGGIPFVKFAGSVRYQPTDVEHYIKSRLRSSTSEVSS